MLHYTFFKNPANMLKCREHYNKGDQKSAAPADTHGVAGCAGGRTIEKLKTVLQDAKPHFIALKVDLGSAVDPSAIFYMGHELVLEKPATVAGAKEQHVLLHSSYVGGHAGFQFSEWVSRPDRTKLPVPVFLERLSAFMNAKTVGQAAKKYGALFFVPRGLKPQVKREIAHKTGKTKWEFAPKYRFVPATVDVIGKHQNDKPAPFMTFSAMEYVPADVQSNLAEAVKLYAEMLTGDKDAGRTEGGKAPHQGMDTCGVDCYGIDFDGKCKYLPDADDLQCTWSSATASVSPTLTEEYCKAACCEKKKGKKK
jgi:hypothetical protein